MKIYEYYIDLKKSKLVTTEYKISDFASIIDFINFGETCVFSKHEAIVYFPFKLNKHQENKIEKMIAYKIIYGEWKMH